MNTNITGFRWFSKNFVLWTKAASALEGLRWRLYTEGVEMYIVCHVLLSFLQIDSLTENTATLGGRVEVFTECPVLLFQIDVLPECGL